VVEPVGPLVGEVGGHDWYGITRAASGESGTVEGEVDEGLGDAVGVVTEEVAFVGEVAGDGFDAEGADAVEVSGDGRLALVGVFIQQRGGDGRGIDEGVVEDARAVSAAVVEDFFYVLGCGEAERLVGLGHEVCDVDAGGFGGGDGLGDAVNQKISDQRGVERAGADSDEIGVGDGLEGCGEGLCVGRRKHELDDAMGAGGDAGFAMYQRAILHARDEGDVAVGGGVDAATGGENLRGHLHGLGEVAGDAGEGSEEEIAEIVALQAAVMEAVLKKLGEQEFVLGERDHAVADVSGGEHVEFFAETARGATIVGDGDDGCKVADEAGKGWGLLLGLGL